MADQLSLKRLDPEQESYATLYEHPELGKIRVGTISLRTSLGNIPDPWSWMISTNLAPEYSPDHGAVPDDERTWIRRSSLNFAGTASTMKAAIARWRAAWPAFRDARTDVEWHDLKAEQDYGEKKLMIYDAYKLPGVSEDVRVQLQEEMGRPGAAPHWLREMLARGRA